MVASGTPIFFPKIKDVDTSNGNIRARYPIMPAHCEGNAIWKEIQALKDIVLQPFTEKDKYYEDFPVGEPKEDNLPEPPSANHTVIYTMPPADENYHSHIHYVFLTPDEVEYLKTPETTLAVNSSQSWGHSHQLVIWTNQWGGQNWETCDEYKRTCWDRAGQWMKLYVPKQNK